MSKTFIVAEAGVNHNGDLAIAKQLIDAAKESGADAVKFQSFKAEKLYRDTDERQKLFKSWELSWNQHFELWDYAEKTGIEIFSSVFDIESLELLLELKTRLLKIPSGEITNLPLLRAINDNAINGMEVILSTGMSHMAEIAIAVQELSDVDLTLLHCTSCYPTLPEDVNLLAMQTLATYFEIPVGYSDHTTSLLTPVIAVSLGACILEKHFTLSRYQLGADHHMSTTPFRFKRMVKKIRTTETMLGSPRKMVLPCEEETRTAARRSASGYRE